MMKGEKMYSYVKYEKEVESEYRRALDQIKRPEEVIDVFGEYAFKLISMIYEGVPSDMKENIKLLTDKEKVEINGKLKEKLSEILEKSDLTAILNRMAQDAINRYKKLKNDDERTDLFRLGDNAKIH
ncbi:MAG: hypothetical protein J7L34_06275 [Thermotogaceae bacterium]|nr:hypothetical protein [Thermotogaceae bacterium]